MNQITLTQPDDMHLHLRDGAAMQSVLQHSATQFARAVIMPNLAPPITTVQAARQYRTRICAALPAHSHFAPYMTLYLTDTTTVEEIQKIERQDTILGVKLYPAGATTHSAAGVTQLTKTFPVLAMMEQLGIPLLIHGEVTDTDVDIFDREARFIDTTLLPLHRQFPHLKIVFEHITTQQAVDFVNDTPPHIVATITAHHLLLNRNALLVGGIRPHHYCLPVLKRERHRVALLTAATSGNPKYFLGTDSAPHSETNKTNACGCAGLFTAHAAIELYAEAFSQNNSLEKLEAFASFHGADFYGLARNSHKITLVQTPWHPPAHYPLGNDVVVPFRANETIMWKIQNKISHAKL